MQDLQALLGSSRLHLETFLRTFLTFKHTQLQTLLLATPSLATQVRPVDAF